MGEAVEGQCRVPGAVSLKAIPSPFGRVAIGGTPVMSCGFARVFAGWVREVAAPLTSARMHSPLVAVETGSGFACRTRIGGVAGKPSEHGKGTALDIATFVLEDGRRLAVGKDDASHRDLMQGLRTSACGYFTTVLGPGSNAAHADHLHLDTGLHGRSANYRICE
jgi:hypothetical protein